MARQYEYRARDASGQVFTGVILAEDEASVAGHIRGKGMYVAQIKEAKSRQDVMVLLKNLKRVTTRDLAVFSRQFSTMLEAGLPILTCLRILSAQTNSFRFRDALQNVYKNVQEGIPLAKAMEDRPDVFPSIMVSMVEAGELGGVLDVVMRRLALQFEKDHRLNERMKAAMTYPLVVLGMAVVVVFFVLTFILPTFVGMFQSMNVELPLLTRLLMKISGFLSKYWAGLIILIAAAGYGIAVTMRYPAGKAMRDQFLLTMPVFGPLIRKVAVARFTRTLASLIRGGVPLLSALDVVKKTTGNVLIIRALSESQDSIREGEDLSTRLGASEIFPPMVVQMVAVGEQSGNLDQMLDKVADFSEEDVEDMVGRLSSMLEPFLISFLGLVIGAIIIAILVPMFDVITNVNKAM